MAKPITDLTDLSVNEKLHRDAPPAGDARPAPVKRNIVDAVLAGQSVDDFLEQQMIDEMNEIMKQLPSENEIAASADDYGANPFERIMADEFAAFVKRLPPGYPQSNIDEIIKVTRRELGVRMDAAEQAVGIDPSQSEAAFLDFIKSNVDIDASQFEAALRDIELKIFRYHMITCVDEETPREKYKWDTGNNIYYHIERMITHKFTGLFEQLKTKHKSDKQAKIKQGEDEFKQFVELYQKEQETIALQRASLEKVFAECKKDIPAGYTAEQHEVFLKVFETLKSGSLKTIDIPKEMILDLISRLDQNLPGVHYFPVVLICYGTKNLLERSAKTMDEALKMIHFSDPVKNKIKQIIDKNKTLCEAMLKKLELILTKHSSTFMLTFRKNIPVDMYGELSVGMGKFTSNGLIPINRAHLTKFNQNMAALRVRLQEKHVQLFALIKDEKLVKECIKLKLDRFKKREEALVELANTYPENSFKRFFAITSAEIEMMRSVEDFDFDAICIEKSLKSDDYQSLRKRILDNFAKHNKGGEQSVPQAEVRARDDQKLKELEQLSREHDRQMKEQANQQMLSLKAAQDAQQKQIAEKNKAKKEILSACESLNKTECQLLLRILRENNLHKVIEELDFEKLVNALRLPITGTHHSAGGSLVTIPQGGTVSYHHSKGDKAGTLDGATLKAFRDALITVGITEEELAKIYKAKFEHPRVL